MKKVIIDNCSNCPFFDNQYYGYHEICKVMGIKIERISEDFYRIPEDCPLEDTDEPKTDLI